LRLNAPLTFEGETDCVLNVPLGNRDATANEQAMCGSPRIVCVACDLRVERSDGLADTAEMGTRFSRASRPAPSAMASLRASSCSSVTDSSCGRRAPREVLPLAQAQV
jgi:hypothetical protein